MRIGLVGTGHWAKVTHAVAMERSEACEFVGVYGRNQVAAQSIADDFGVTAFSQFSEMLSQVDAVSFAIPPHVQVPLGLEAAAEGKHLLLEKPISVSVADANALRDAVHDANVASIVFFTSRFAAPERAWLAEVGKKSPWKGGWARWMGSAYEPDSPYRNSTWRKDKGALWDLGPHVLSIFVPVLGPVAKVEAVTGEGDLVHLILTHQSGATSTASLSLTTPPAASGMEMALWGDGGTTVMPAFVDPPENALVEAISQLALAAEMETPAHQFDVDFGALVVDVLAQAEMQCGLGEK